MFIPGPSLFPLIAIQRLDEFLSEFEGMDSISGGVAVYGSAAAYALVWELGSKRLKSPGPKTLWSVNREGEVAILTRQAPLGYVGFVSDQFWPIIEKELATIKFSSKTTAGIRIEIEVALDNASQAIARIISDAAPVDTGDLRSQIQYVDSAEMSSSNLSALESQGTLLI